jgi:hypothetical protein
MFRITGRKLAPRDQGVCLIKIEILRLNFAVDPDKISLKLQRHISRCN